jgi:hypothetical protein
VLPSQPVAEDQAKKSRSHREEHYCRQGDILHQRKVMNFINRRSLQGLRSGEVCRLQRVSG